tara:strand:+ start:5065 stop:5415 length:351 start_codon:yes stop_codon:yes gene_type:complete
MNFRYNSSIFLACICTIFTSSGQYFLKIGADSFDDEIKSFLNIYLFAGLFLYVIGGILLILALGKGDLSLVYPLISLSFVWVFLISFFILNEAISLVNWFGLLTIISGVIMVGNSS